MTMRRLAFSAVAVVLLVSRAASAQSQYTAQADSPQWLKDRRYNEGIGIRTGDLEIHPGIAGEAGYDSNWFLRSDRAGVENGPSPSTGTPPAPIIPAVEFRITPSLYLSTLDPERKEGDLVATPPSVAFRAGINATYREFIGVSSDSDASQPQNEVSKQRNVSGAADLRMDILPQRPWGAAVFGSFSRTIQPNVVAADPDVSFDQDAVNAGIELVARPGSGTLDWHLGYQFHDTIFEESVGTPYDNITNEAYTQGRWKFRPRTALVYDASLRFISYSNAGEAAPIPLENSTPVRARIGLSGLITERFSALAMIGWGASFYDTAIPNQPQFDSVIAQAELRWFLSASPGIAKATELGLALSSISLGYTRDFQNSYLGSYYTQDRGYLKFYYLFAGRAIVSLEGGAAAIEYPTLIWTDAAVRHPSFTDVRLDATLFSEYRFTDTFGLNATVRYSANLSDTQILVSNTTPGLYDMAWKRFEAYLGLRWFM
jgi:hypothetical protein